ncbi:putative F-box/FBD/LRR-repeat protein At4g00315 [Setaria viridis]|uniref:putative F-box/FBD/LRR-repeat protein At4g00315 n=1 Tax=Setaria viridis TaxID=4556 RepID=UPI00149351CC|nr:putative F-box/FBD/LRR-repeat protein At4g00315 [Setaria viridis]
MDTEPPPPSPIEDYYMEASPPAAGEPYPGPTEYVTPRSLFSCAALRSLRLGGCWLDVPPTTAALPSLATLHLTRVTGRRDAVQDLVDACPRLADLKLEACRDLERILVPDARLRRLALRCCHELADVFVGDSSELRAFEYRGGVPGPSLLNMPQPSEISLCTLDFCGVEPAEPPEFTFLLLYARVERLHLTSARLLGRGVFDHGVLYPYGLRFLTFPELRNLELTGMLPEDDAAAAIAAVTRILERTPRLGRLENGYSSRYSDEEEDMDIHAAHQLRYDQHATLAVPDAEIPCLREINLVHYQGAMAHAQRMLAKFLLRNAPVVGEVCCEFARGPLAIQTDLMEEIKGWVMNKSANMIFF